MSPIKFGVTTYIWSAQFTSAELPVLPRIKEHGFDGVEIPVFRPTAVRAGEIRRGIEAAGLDCVVSSALVPGLSLVSDDPGVRRKTRQHLVDVVETAAELGASIVAGPLYTPVGELPGRRRTPSEWLWAVEAYHAIVPTLTACNVTLAIEPLNRFETYFLNTAADALALCDAVNHSRVGVLFDTFHANIEEKDVAAACASLARHLKHVHTSENDRGTPGTGHVDWAGVFQSLREQRYAGWLTIESFGFALGDLSAAASIWRDIETTPETIAFEGVKFVKEQARSSGLTSQPA
jgi:D-psicose/D-tagatose/L-ribulose 3-epimerase